MLFINLIDNMLLPTVMEQNVTIFNDRKYSNTSCKTLPAYNGFFLILYAC